MAEQQNWQRHGPFDLGMHEYTDEDFELDFREEEFWEEVPDVDINFMPLDHTQLGKLYLDTYNCYYNVTTLRTTYFL